MGARDPQLLLAGTDPSTLRLRSHLYQPRACGWGNRGPAQEGVCSHAPQSLAELGLGHRAPGSLGVGLFLPVSSALPPAQVLGAVFAALL